MTAFMYEECPSCKRDVMADEVSGNQLTTGREVYYHCECGADWVRPLIDAEVDTFRRLHEEARRRGLR